MKHYEYEQIWYKNTKYYVEYLIKKYVEDISESINNDKN